MTCDNCHQRPAARGAVLQGKFGQYCNPCLQGETRQASAGSAAFHRQADRDAYELDLLQPWDASGTPNKEFITNYPDEAKDIFTQEELEKYG